MTVDIENVYESFSKVLSDIAKHRDQQRLIENYLADNHNMNRGLFLELVASPDKAEVVDADKLLVFINAIDKCLPNANMRISDYYTTSEIKDINNYKFEKSSTLSLPIQYEKVLALTGSEKEFVTSMSYEDIVKHRNDNMWLYNFLIQRSPVKTMNKKGVVKVTPKLNRKNVNEIKEMILSGDFKPDAPITINVLCDGNESMYYDELDWSLLIESATEQNIVDGYHRIVALQELNESNPEIQGHLFVSFRFYELEEAQTYLGQINSFSVMSKSRTKKLKSKDFSDKIVNRLSDKAPLKGRISDENTVRLKFNDLTNFAVLTESIDKEFNPISKKEVMDISPYLIEFFSYMFDSYPDEFINKVKEIHRISYINHHNLFVGYIAMAAHLYREYGREVNGEKIVEIMNKINFNRQDSDIATIMNPQGKTNSNEIKKQIREYFEKVIETV